MAPKRFRQYVRLWCYQVQRWDTPRDFPWLAHSATSVRGHSGSCMTGYISPHESITQPPVCSCSCHQHDLLLTDCYFYSQHDLLLADCYFEQLLAILPRYLDALGCQRVYVVRYFLQMFEIINCQIKAIQGIRYSEREQTWETELKRSG